MSESKEPFLARWSRLKRNDEVTEKPPSEPHRRFPVEPVGGGRSEEKRPPKAELPLIESITLDTDVTGFFQPDVDDSLRRMALKKLFSAHHFNVMDGLDVYIDDYSKPDPIPPELLASLLRAQVPQFEQPGDGAEEDEGERGERVQEDVPTTPGGEHSPQGPPGSCATDRVNFDAGAALAMEIMSTEETGE